MDALSPPPKGLAAIMKWLKEQAIPAINARTPLRADVCDINETTGGFQALPVFPIQGAAAALILPWQFLPQLDGTTNKVQVNQYSYIMTGDDTGDTEDIDQIDELWSPDAGDYAYLHLTLDESGDIDDVELVVDGGWDSYPQMYDVNDDDPDSPYISDFYMLLAAFKDPTDDTPAYFVPAGDVSDDDPQYLNVVPMCSQNLLEVIRVMGGISGWSLEFWSGSV